MAHRKWEETKPQPSMLPSPAVPGSCLVSFHFLWAIHPIRPVQHVLTCNHNETFQANIHIGTLEDLLPLSFKLFIRPSSFHGTWDLGNKQLREKGANLCKLLSVREKFLSACWEKKLPYGAPLSSTAEVQIRLWEEVQGGLTGYNTGSWSIPYAVWEMS